MQTTTAHACTRANTEIDKKRKRMQRGHSCKRRARAHIPHACTRTHTHTCLASAFTSEFVGVWGIPAFMHFVYAVLFCVMVKSRLAPDRKWHSLIQAAARPRIIKTHRLQDNMLNRFSRGKLHSCNVVDIVADAVDDGMLSSRDPFFKIGRSPDRHNAERNVWRSI